ncbi:hypothetical protein [Amycolatopsis tolypomycina]|uniref:hypothetical protein n=1 Tax=Amycolatopsis tolypomycina TaxID=208445 RepID=UPI00142D9F1E|nr:hypothetical protein [Amycolatopsis tolypomycina]
MSGQMWPIMGSRPGATGTVRAGGSGPGSVPLNGHAGVCCAAESSLIRFPTESGATPGAIVKRHGKAMVHPEKGALNALEPIS